MSAEPSTSGHQGLQYNSQTDEEQGSREAEAFPGEQHVTGEHTFLNWLCTLVSSLNQYIDKECFNVM